MNLATAAWIGLGLSVAAQNCNSLNVTSSIKNQDLKISSIVGYKADVILLSDTRLNGRDRAVSERLNLHYKMYHNSSKKSRGVAVLFSNRLSVELLERAADVDENILLLKVKINGNILIVGSIYGPNLDANCETFFDFIRQTCQRWHGFPIILGGDWNATPSMEDVAHNLDVIFMRNLPSRHRSERVAELAEDLDLSDPFRALHPDSKEFSYYPSGNLRRNRSRIDFFLVSSGLYNNIQSCSIAQGFCRKSFDHKPIFLEMKRKERRGRACIYDSTLNNPLLDQYIRCAVHLCTIDAALNGAGLLTTAVLTDERNKILDISKIVLIVYCLSKAR